MSHLRLRLCVVIAALVALVGSANAFAAGNLVISQVYGGGGNSGASYTHDFVELFNRGTVSESLNGMSIQYASATGTGNFGSSTTQLTELPPASLQPGQYMLIQEATTAPVGAPLPAPDLIDLSPIPMSGTAGKVALVTGTTTLGCNGGSTPCAPAALARIVDLVGYGNANFFEGTGAATALSNIASAGRNNVGCRDTDNNATDFFFLTPPGPRNSASVLVMCEGPPPPTNPSPSGSANPASVLPGAQTTLSVTVTPGANPTSTGISVSGDLTLIGGSATTAFADDGLGADAAAGDNVFTYRATVPPTTTPGTRLLDVTARDAELRSGSTTISLLVESPPPPLVAIHTIQGAAHISPRLGELVATRGIVTGKIGSSFYIQDPDPDGDAATSEGIQIFGATAASAVSVGDLVTVQGRVTEFRASSSTSPNPNLSITELTTPTILSKSATTLTIDPTVIGNGGRTQPNTVIEDDASSGNVETSGIFDPAQDGLDFYESLEGMLVQMNDLVSTSYTFTSFGEIWVVGDNGANATVMSPRGALVIGPGDLNPERMVIDDEMFKASGARMPLVNTGAPLPGPHVGVMDWAFGEYRIQLRAAPVATNMGVSVREIAIAAGTDKVSIATFNVENLSGGEPDAKYNTLAAMIVNNLAAPDIVGLEEIQDNNGAVGGTSSPVVDANVTLDRLVAAIQLAGGPTYAYRQINPVAHQDGGEPGGNIRVGFLFRTDRGLAFVDRPGGDSTTAVSIVSGPEGPQLSISPGRIAPANEAWTSSRKPLAAEFTYNGHKLFVIVNHFNSKGGDQGLFGPWQPPVLSSEVQRIKQATLVAGFVGDLLAADPTANIAVIGDLNDFQFSPPVQKLKDAGLVAMIETLPPNERYSYVFDGNGQALDHIMVSRNLFDHAAAAAGYDIVHVNAEFLEQASDHDPQLVQLTMPTPSISATRSPAANAAGWNNSAVTVSFTCVDPLSALVGSCPAPVTLSSEGADQSVSRSVMTEGGLSLAAGVSNVDIDLTKPTVTYSGGKATYGIEETISITCAATDALSGLASSTCTNISGPATSFGLGLHTFSASALDRAGNTGTGSVSFNVVVSFRGLCALTHSYSDKQSIADALCAKLDAAAAKADRKGQQADLHAYVNQVEAQSGKSFTAEEAATLAALAGSL